MAQDTPSTLLGKRARSSASPPANGAGVASEPEAKRQAGEGGAGAEGAASAAAPLVEDDSDDQVGPAMPAAGGEASDDEVGPVLPGGADAPKKKKRAGGHLVVWPTGLAVLETDTA